MTQLIDAIIQQKTSPTSPRKENQRRLFTRTECSEAKGAVRSGRRMAREEEFEVETNFGRWIRRVKNKNKNRSEGMFEQWPHKKMVNCQKLRKL
jgi:DNA-dependent RNA polymerase auxiliary subunit epsilon